MKEKLSFHIIFWTTIKGYELIFYGSTGDFSYALQTSLSRFPAELIIFYSGIYYILPNYFESKGIKKLLVSVLVVLVISIIVNRTTRFVLSPSIRIDNNLFKTVFDFPSFFVAPFYFLPTPAVGLVIYTLRRLRDNEVQRKEAEKEKVIAEINLLKSQVQPHFLFNTLNNLYSLAIRSSAQTPDFILHLSRMMEYILYKSSKERVLLEVEMQHIENYVELEKLRYGNRLEVSWDLDKSLYNEQIAPLLLFPFIENAFKHGASSDDDNIWISISLKREGRQLIYTVVNSIPGEEKRTSASANGGFGLKNLSQRLQLAYEGRYELGQNVSDASHMSILKLSIS